MAESIVAQIRSAFRFLEAEYGFTAGFSKEDEGKPYLGGEVEYASSLTVVGVGVERLGVVLPPDIARAKDQVEFKRAGRISLDRIYEYAVTTRQERSRLASRNLEELKKAWKEVVEPNRLDLLGLIAADGSLASDSREETELRAYAHILRKYAEPFLRGDFSDWLELHEYEWNCLVAGEMVSGRFSERGRGGGVTASEAEERFWSYRVYLEALRREYGKA